MGERTQTYLVPDVSCGHCVKAITDELTKLPGVGAVAVDLESKEVTVRHDERATDAALRCGIEEAGFDVAAA